jgi:aromatic ring-opening dioxygenase catalytic subunit (LigB family)
MPLLGEPGHKSMTEFLQRVEMGLENPKAICVISAHWEEKSVKISTGSKQLLYYYYGSPPR